MLSLSAIKSTTALGSNFRVAQLLMKANLRTSYTIGLGTNRILCRPMYKTVINVTGHSISLMKAFR